MLTMDMGNWLIVVMGLASFRLTRLIVYDKITAFIRAPFFDEIEEKDENGLTEIYLVPKKKGLQSWIGELLSCYWCTGFWASLFLFGLYLYEPVIGQFLILLLAVAAIGSILEVIVGKLLGN